MSRRAAVAAAIAAALMLPLLPATTAHADTPAPPPPPVVGLEKQPQLSRDTNTIIVSFDKAQTDPKRSATEAVQQAADQVAGADIAKVAPITDTMVAVTLDQTVTNAEAASIGERAEQTDGVKAAEPAGTFTTDTTSDTYYSYLWNLKSPSASSYGVNAETAWPTTTGAGAIVGVIDTGITAHPDLTGSTTSIIGGNVIAGYDFITSTTASGDGTGRDGNPADAGDYCATDGSNSSWHGTHVAGIIAAIRNNSAGVVGVAPGAKIEPLRALGRCGGSEADIIAAILWGAGQPVVGLPGNPYPVDVLNLSLGGAGACSTAMQSAINTAVGQGIPVVVATGNENAALSTSMPANCNNVIRVTATTFEGTRAPYSNYGTGTVHATIAAPGGSGASSSMNDWIASTWNAGTTGPGTPAYVGMVGTSMAAPHVAGVAALLKAKNPDLTPSQIQTLMTSTATTIPTCSAYACGAGVVNAAKAVAALTNSPLSNLGIMITGQFLVGATVTAEGTGVPGATFTYLWLRDGTVVGNAASYTLTSADAGHGLSVKVTGTLNGLSQSKSSTPTTVVANPLEEMPTLTISGDPMVGSTLHTTYQPSTFGSDSIQWLLDGVELSGATGLAHNVAGAYLGHQLSVRYTLNIAGLGTASTTSAPVTVVANTAVNVETPVITGTPMVGATVTTAGTGAGSNAIYRYQWLRNGTPITGATNPSYTILPTDLAASISVKVTAYVYTVPASKTSSPVTVVPNSVTKLAVPVITGTPRVGLTLSTAGTGVDDGATYTYQWYRSGTAISGATGPTRTLSTSDYGKVMTVKVTATYLGQKASKTSAATTKVGAAPFTNTVLPYTTGTYKKGYTLKAKYGTWSPTPTTVKYRWLRNGSSISGATSSSYKLTSSDRGKNISVRITVYRTGYVTTTAYSLPHKIA